MAMIIPKIQIQSQIDNANRLAAADASSKNGVYLTRALQCQRIDPVRDVKNDAVYLNESRGPTTLKEELDMVSALDAPLDVITSAAGTRAAQIQHTLSIVVGVVLGILIFAIVAYFALRHTYKGYEKTIAENNAIIAAAAEAAAAAAKKQAPH
jgi:hypothetical protein